MNAAPIPAKTEAYARILLTASVVHVLSALPAKDAKGYKSSAATTIHV